MGANDLKVSLPINSTSVAKNSQISNNVETKTTVQNFLDDLDDDEIMKVVVVIFYHDEILSFFSSINF